MLWVSACSGASKGEMCLKNRVRCDAGELRHMALRCGESWCCGDGMEGMQGGSAGREMERICASR